MKNISVFQNKEKGASLVEVMVALAILSIVSVTTAQFWANSYQVKRIARIRSIMISIADSIENKLRSPSILFFSLFDPENVSFKNCLLGASDGCTEELIEPGTSAKNILTLTLSADETNIERITSSPSHPVLFDISGKRCDDKSSQTCIFEAQSFFYVTCPKETSLQNGTCHKGAHMVYVSFRVKLVGDKLKDIGKLPDLPHKTFYYTYTSQKILGPTSASECNPGAIMIGVGEQGKPTCKCVQPYIDNNSQNNKGPLCDLLAQEAHRCHNGEVLRGFTQEGLPRCVPFKDAYECEEEVDSDQAKFGNCSDGYWANLSYRDNCYFSCRIVKTNKRNECVSDEGKNFEGDSSVAGCRTASLRCCRPRNL